MNSNKPSRRTYLFLVRVWTEEEPDRKTGSEAVLRQGKVQHVVNGESREFDDWQGLVEVLEEMLSAATPDDSETLSEDED